MSVYEMSKCFSSAKVTFLGVQGKGSLFKACQNDVKPIIVFSQSATENDDVIEIIQTKLPFETMQYLSINLSTVAGALHKPNGITWNSNKPSKVQKHFSFCRWNA